MNRRQLIQYAGVSAIATIGGGLLAKTSWAAPAKAGGTAGLSIQAFGHSCFLLTGGGQRLLINPFKPTGCTSGYKAPKVDADLILISSRLLDEGYIDGQTANRTVLFEPGLYQFASGQIQGIRTPHDRVNGRRFGMNIAWRWTQGGLNILHLGGAAAPISIEQKILMGSPDVLFIPVGGGAKTYDAAEAQAAIGVLNPKIVIPTQYRHSGATSCDLGTLDSFLKGINPATVQRRGSSVSLSPKDLPKSGFSVQVIGL
jgi:L-ascorbate metabolism protein UlaG (beta-lactamase superfamily)